MDGHAVFSISSDQQYLELADNVKTEATRHSIIQGTKLKWDVYRGAEGGAIAYAAVDDMTLIFFGSQRLDEAVEDEIIRSISLIEEP